MRMLILSGKKALQEQVSDIRPLEKAIEEYMKLRANYQTLFCYYDTANAYRTKPVRKDAEAIRGYVSEIEENVGEIDALLLLGGDEVIPFFRLDNPCDDADENVLSDNPYASRDDNYVIPERICARIPDNGCADFIVKQLTNAKPLYKGSFGLTARVWLRASEDVYRAIGEPEDLKISPPVTSDGFEEAWLQNKDYLYFNVHGSKATANWYGQDAGDYPVAMQPQNIIRAAGVVASESCYGAYIIDKAQDDAICLRFLAEDEVLGFCGSTTIAYGPAAPPSGEADLLVKYFFEYLEQGLTMGESLRNAKLDFARKALRRRGFLDDDDQKTLLQFVLYGDPTLRVRENQAGA
jgi:hypothetical protein